MAAFTEGANFSTSANGKTLDPRLLDILKTAAAQYGMDVQATSGVQGRSTGTKNHPGGYAVDIKLIGPDGKALPNYQNAKSFPAYEKFAQTARVVQQQKYPELDNVFRWGGYFAGGPNPMDLMHFDINPNLHGAMAGGSWDGGVTSSYAKARGITTYNPGLGTAEGQRQVAVVKQGLAGGPLPPMNIPQVGTALDVIDRVVPRPMPSSIASAYAAQNVPPPLPRGRIAPPQSSIPQDASFGIRGNGRTTFPTSADFTDAGLYAPGRGAGLGGMEDPHTAALLAPQVGRSVAASGQATAVPQSVGIPGSASLSGSIAPVPMPGRPASLSSVQSGAVRSKPVQTGAAPRQSATVQPLPSSYTLNPDALVGAAKKAGVISGPASWLPTNTIWDGAFGQQGMRSQIEYNLPTGSYLDNNTVHVNNPDALANSYLQKVPSLFRPMAREAVIPAIHVAEAQGYVTPQWPAPQTVPLPVPRPATPSAPIRAPTVQDTLNEQAMMRRAPTAALPSVAAGVSPTWWQQAFTPKPPVYPPVNLNRPVGVLPSYVMPRSLPANFYAQPAQTRVALAAAPAPVMPATMPTAIAAQRAAQNNSSYFGGKQNAINDTLRTLGFNV